LRQPFSSSDPSSRLADALFLLGLGFFFCLWGIGEGSLASWDEAQYAQVAKEMLRSGDWVNLSYGGSDWYVKPPLAIWATAFFFSLAGVGEFGARVFSGLAGVATVLATYLLGMRLFGRRAALFGAGALLSSTDYLHFSRWGMTDIPHLFFFTAALAFFAAGSGPSACAGFWIMAALAFMTKGPVVVLAFGTALGFALWAGRWDFLKARAFWVGAALAAGIVVPWHLAAYLHNPDLFLKDYVGTHWLGRAATALDGHASGWYFYVRSLINKYHPWVALLPLSLPFVLYRAVKLRDAGSKLLVVWIALVLGFFTFVVQTKLRWYIYPAYPALSLSVGVLLAAWTKERQERWVKAAIGLVLVLHIPFSSVMRHDYSPALKGLAPDVRAMASPEEDVYLYRYHDEPAAVFYFERPVAYADSEGEIDAELARRRRVLVVATEEAFGRDRGLFDSRGFRTLRQTRGLKENLVLLSAAGRDEGV
jgi:4-amino-4-deoxy-L-arabinose transferase-like glycosyltransferase